MAMEHNPPMPDPDDFDRQLRELTSGQGGTAKFREPSAQERARQAARPDQRRTTGRGGSRKARQLRRPAGPARSRPSGGGKAWKRLRRKSPKTSRKMSPSARKQRIRSVATTVAVLLAFAALVLALHLLGFGPQ